MPPRMQWSMGHDNRVKVAFVRLALRKVRPLKRPTDQWVAVEVCGVGVPQPGPNLLAARACPVAATEFVYAIKESVSKKFPHSRMIA